MSEEKKYSSEWKKLKLLSLGGKWAYGVGIVVDNYGVEKVRLVKGKLKENIKRDLTNWIEADLQKDPAPISQVQKMNFKTREEWDILKETIGELCDNLPQAPPSGDEEG